MRRVVRDRVTANLPARSFEQTARFYGALGFAVAFRDAGWMILRSGELEVEFFPHPELDPAISWFSACVRVADPDALHRRWSDAGLPPAGIPRLTSPQDEPFGARMFALVDPDGSLLRCLGPARAA
jgi:catechol 2,3-dioxygenase-like lactoylglutathione lyase family enzyme